MSHDKAPGAAPPGNENSAEHRDSETVLDFLWNPEAADHSAEHSPGQHAPDSQLRVQDEAAGEALEDALARYSSWLNSWGEQESPD